MTYPKPSSTLVGTNFPCINLSLNLLRIVSTPPTHRTWGSDLARYRFSAYISFLKVNVWAARGTRRIGAPVASRTSLWLCVPFPSDLRSPFLYHLTVPHIPASPLYAFPIFSTFRVVHVPTYKSLGLFCIPRIGCKLSLISRLSPTSGAVL